MTTRPGPHANHIHAGDPRYDGFRVTTLYVFTAVDPVDNQEGVVPDLYGFPLIASDKVHVDDLRPLAQHFTALTGLPVTLHTFELAHSEPLS